MEWTYALLFLLFHLFFIFNSQPILEFNHNSLTQDYWPNEGSAVYSEEFTGFNHLSLTGIASVATQDGIESVCFESDTCLKVNHDISPSKHKSLSMELYAFQLSTASDHGAWCMSQDPGHYARTIMMQDSRFGPNGVSGEYGLAMGVDHSYIGHNLLENNKWNHIVAVWDADSDPNVCTATLYVNGDDAVTTDCTGQTDGLSYFCLNRNPMHINHQWNGCFSKVGLYDYALSSEEIKSLQTAYNTDIVLSEYDSILDSITIDDNFQIPLISKTKHLLKNLLSQDESQDIAVNAMAVIGDGSDESFAASDLQPYIEMSGDLLSSSGATIARGWGPTALGSSLTAAGAGMAMMSSVISLTTSKGPSMQDYINQIIDAIGDLISTAFFEETLTQIQLLLVDARDGYRDFENDLDILTALQYEWNEANDVESYCVWTDAFDDSVHDVLYGNEAFQLNTATYLKEELFISDDVFDAEQAVAIIEVLYDLCRIATIRHAALLSIYAETSRQLDECSDYYNEGLMNEIESRQQKAFLDITNDEEDLAKTLSALPMRDGSDNVNIGTPVVLETLYQCIVDNEDKCLLIYSWIKELSVVIIDMVGYAMPPYWTVCAQPYCAEGATAIESDVGSCGAVKCSKCFDYDIYWTQCREGLGGCAEEREGGIEVAVIRTVDHNNMYEVESDSEGCGMAGGEYLLRFKCQICYDEEKQQTIYIPNSVPIIGIVSVLALLLMINIIVMTKMVCCNTLKTKDEANDSEVVNFLQPN